MNRVEGRRQVEALRREESDRFRHAGMLCVLLVLFIHATTSRYCPAVAAQSPLNELNNRLQASVAFGFARTAVPFFFFVSGFLFFRRVDSLAQIRTKMRSRFFSLVVPYMVWSTLWLVLAFLLCRLDLEAAAPFQHLFAGSFSVVLNTWLLDPIPGQLWFVRDLIVLCAISPLLFLSFRFLGPSIPILAFTAWLFVPEHVVIENRSAWEVTSISGLCMFSVGGWLSRFGVPKLDSPAWLVLSLSLWCATIAAMFFNPFDLALFKDEGTRRLFDRFGIMCGMVAIWSGCHIGRSSLQNRVVQNCSGHSFFVYASHYPLLGFCVAICMKTGGCSAIWQTIVFLCLPLLVASALFAFAIMLSRHLPWLYGSLSGYRGLPLGAKNAANN